MIAITDNQTQPVLIPRCFIDWVKAREAVCPDFSFVIASGEVGEKVEPSWTMHNNVVTYRGDNIICTVRILTGQRMDRRDLSLATGLDIKSLTTVAPFVHALPLATTPNDIVPFTATPYNTLAELDKSFEASKHKSQD